MPSVPILMLDNSNDIDLTIDDVLNQISTYPTIDLQLSANEVSENLTVSVTGARARQLLSTPSSTPVNALNLRSSCAPPRAIANIEQFSLLDEFQEYDSAGHPGKRHTKIANDLSSCNKFRLLGPTGSISLPHIDHHGVWTWVQCLEGRKLWPMYPQLDRSTFLTWAQTGRMPADVRPFAIYIPANASLVMPPRRLHFPITLSTCLMVGWMFWRASEMCSIIRASMYEIHHPHITNEDPPKEMTQKLTLIGEDIRRNGTRRLWQHLSRTEYENLLQTWNWQRRSRCCSCQDLCTECPCSQHGGCKTSCKRGKCGNKLRIDLLWPED